jgi:archaellum biogenesis protein FlaJ (TadC family)
MKTLFKFAFFSLVLLILVTVAGSVLLWHGVHTGMGPADWHVHFDGDDWEHAADLSDWIGGAIGLSIAAVVCLFVVPVVLLLGVALPILIVGGVMAALMAGAVAAVVGVGALLTSPLIILGLILFLALRNRNRKVHA